MNAPPIAAILSLLLLVLLLGGLITGIVLWITGGSGGRGRKGEMSCGACGYAVRGLSALNCPECGADLRAVGIHRGAGSGKRGMGIALTVVCGGLLMFGCLGSVGFMGVRSSPTISPVHQSTQSPRTSPSVSPSPVEDEAEDEAIDEPTPVESPAPQAPTP